MRRHMRQTVLLHLRIANARVTCHCWCAVLPGCWCCRPLVWAGPAGHPFSPFVRLPMCGWDRCCPAAPCCGLVTAAPAAGAAASLLWRRRPLGAGWAGPLATAGVLLHTPGPPGTMGRWANLPRHLAACPRLSLGTGRHWSPLGTRSPPFTVRVRRAPPQAPTSWAHISCCCPLLRGVPCTGHQRAQQGVHRGGRCHMSTRRNAAMDPKRQLPARIAPNSRPKMS